MELLLHFCQTLALNQKEISGIYENLSDVAAKQLRNHSLIANKLAGLGKSGWLGDSIVGEEQDTRFGGKTVLQQSQ